MERAIGHHRAFGQLFSDILVDTMTESQPAVTENRAPVFHEEEGGCTGVVVDRVLPFVDVRLQARGMGELFLKLRA